MKSALCLSLLTAALLQPLTMSAQAKAGPAGANPAIRMCKAADLSLGTDNKNGAFNGMSHSGTLLVLRNLSPTACRVPQRPGMTFLDQNSKPLPVKLEITGTRFMHPGPVLVPVVIAADAEVTSKLRWVSGEVYDNSTCVSATAITVTLADENQQAALTGQLCGDKAKGITFEASPLAVDPQYKP